MNLIKIFFSNTIFRGERRDTPTFDRKTSQALKGVAILMMLFHHLFQSGRFESYSVIFTPLTAIQATRIASFCKLCVSLFAFISGYGLWKSYTTFKISSQKWCIQRYIKTFSPYWFIVILSWLICLPINGRPYKVYGFERSVFYGIWNMIVDFLGINHLIQEYSSPSMLGTWWYMGAALAYIMISPILFEGLHRFGELTILFAVVLIPRIFFSFPGTGNFYSFLPVFLMGAIFAKRNMFESFFSWNPLGTKDRRELSHFVKDFLLLAICWVSYNWYCSLDTKLWWDFKYCFFAIPLILLFIEFFWLFPVGEKIFGLIGCQATNIYLIHYFLLGVFFKDFFYSFRYFLIIFIVLLFISLFLSIFLEFFKKIIRYDEALEKICNGFIKISSE